jgi:peptidylprolyl isomerase
MFKKTRLVALTSLGLFLGYFTLQAIETNNPLDGNKPSPAAANPTATQTATQNEKNDQIDMKKLSEAFGHFIGRNLQSPGLSFDLESIIKGIREGAAGKPSPLSEKEYEEMMTAVQEKAFKEMSSTNLKSANDFMQKNQKETGVVEVVPGKLQYQILNEGNGPVVEAHSSPKINYTGKYQDGTVFGTSEEMGGPITIPLDQTIPGFSKGIAGMKEGEKRRLFVHPDLGYGTSGQLPPNELLIFDIEVVKANSEPKAKGAAKAGHEDDDTIGEVDEEDFFFDDDDADEDEAKHHSTSPTGTGVKAGTGATAQPQKPVGR